MHEYLLTAQFAVSLIDKPQTCSIAGIQYIYCCAAGITLWNSGRL